MIISTTYQEIIESYPESIAFLEAEKDQSKSKSKNQTLDEFNFDYLLCIRCKMLKMPFSPGKPNREEMSEEEFKVDLRSRLIVKIKAKYKRLMVFHQISSISRYSKPIEDWIDSQWNYQLDIRKESESFSRLPVEEKNKHLSNILEKLGKSGSFIAIKKN